MKNARCVYGFKNAKGKNDSRHLALTSTLPGTFKKGIHMSDISHNYRRYRKINKITKMILVILLMILQAVQRIFDLV